MISAKKSKPHIFLKRDRKKIERTVFPSPKPSSTMSVSCCKCDKLLGSIDYDDGPVNGVTCMDCLYKSISDSLKC